MLGPRGSAVLEGSLRSAREHDLPCEVLEAEEVRRRYPTLAPERGTMALYEAAAGFIDPKAAIDAQLDRAAGLGAEILADLATCGATRLPIRMFSAHRFGKAKETADNGQAMAVSGQRDGPCDNR
jgi:glycine/D-amino acid oxidase-like deaminating enzyme